MQDRSRQFDRESNPSWPSHPHGRASYPSNPPSHPSNPPTLDPAPAFRRADARVAQLPLDSADGCRVTRLPERIRPGAYRPELGQGVPAFHWNHWLVSCESAPDGVCPLLTVRLVCERKHVHAVFGALDEAEARRLIREFELAQLRLPPSLQIPILLDEVVGELPGMTTALLGRVGFWGRRTPAKDQAFRVSHRLRLVVRQRGTAALAPATIAAAGGRLAR